MPKVKNNRQKSPQSALTKALRRPFGTHRGLRWPIRSLPVTIGIAVALTLGAGGAYALYIGGGGSSGSNQATSVNLEKGLVGWWKMNGNTKDSTPHTNDGVNHGTTATTDRMGQANKAMSFNGTSNYVQLPAGVDVQNPISIGAWVNPSSFGSSEGVFVVAADPGPRMVINPSGYPGCDVSVGGSWQSYATSAITIPLNQWSYIACVYNGTTESIYVNGTLGGSATINSGTITYTSSTPLVIGSDNYISNPYHEDFSGSMSDVRIYNRAISATEVTALYNQYDASTTISNGENGLVGWWKLKGNTADSTPYANNGTIHGTVTATADRKGTANGAMSFNGYITTGMGSFPTSTTPRSVFAWVNTTSYPTNWEMIDSYGSSASSQASALSIASGGRISFNGASDDYVSGLVLPLNSWHYIGYTLNGTQITIWLDGQAQTSTLSIAPNAPITTNYIGSWFGGFPFNGSISDLRVYSRVLTSAEVTTQYKSYNSQIELGGSGNAGSVSLGKGLIGYWPLAGNAKDATPYGNNGTVSGTTLTTDRLGRANSAYNFNGSSDRINVPTTKWPTALNAITVAFWAKPVNANNTSLLIANADVTTNRLNIHLPWGDNNIYWDFGDATNGGRLSVAFNSAWFNIWSHWAFTADPATGMKIYRNGVIINSTATSSIFTPGTKTLDIAYYAPGASYWSGAIDDMAIYNRALSTTEVQALYNSYQ